MKIIATTLNAKYIHTNLALRFLKAYALPEFAVEMLEFTLKDDPIDIVTALYKKQPNLIGFSVYIWNAEATKKIIKLLKKILPACKIVVGGPEVTYNAEEWVEAADIVVIGEGEATFKELINCLNTSSDLHSVSGIAFKKHGEVIHTQKRPPLNLKSTPSPYRFPEDAKELPKRITYFETSRGCPFKCQFCLSSIEQGVTFFAEEQVKSDLLYLIENGAKVIKFMDRTFNVKSSYAFNILDFLIKHHSPGMSIQFEITADILDPNLITYLNTHAPAGLFRFEIGVQSTNDRTNEIIQRRQNFNKLAHIVTLIKNGGKVIQHLDLIAGLPEEDYISFRKTFNDVFALGPEELQLGFLKLLHGTGLRKNREKYNYIFNDEPPYEIMSHALLPFSDVIKIKAVEDILEKYWNSGRFSNTIPFLIKHGFNSPFDFFQQFGDFWQDNNWGKIGHQLNDLFNRLHTFLNFINPKIIPTTIDFLKYDFLTKHKHKPQSLWWDNHTEISNEQISHFYKKMATNGAFAGLNLSVKHLAKHSILTTLTVNVDQYLLDKKLTYGDFLLLIYYNPTTKKNTKILTQAFRN